MTPTLAYVRNDNLLRGANLRTITLATGLEAYLTDAATVTVTVIDADAVEVPGQVWPLALTYITGSQGGFLGLLRNELTWTDGSQWMAIITVDNGADQRGEFILRVDVQDRIV